MARKGCMFTFVYVYIPFNIVTSIQQGFFLISYKILLLDKKKINLVSTKHKWYL